jgi:hypothetical protein
LSSFDVLCNKTKLLLCFLTFKCSLYFLFISFQIWSEKISSLCLLGVYKRGGEAIVLGLVTNRRESVQGHGAAVCGNWFGLADSLHMPQPAVAGGRGREGGRSF